MVVVIFVGLQEGNMRYLPNKEARSEDGMGYVTSQS